MSDEKKVEYYQVVALAVSGKNGQMFRNKSTKRVDGEIVQVATIVTADDFEEGDAEKLVASKHLKRVTENEAEKEHQRKNMTLSSGSSEPEKSFGELKKEYLELGGEESKIKANWKAKAMGKALLSLKRQKGEDLEEWKAQIRSDYLEHVGEEAPEDMVDPEIVAAIGEAKEKAAVGND